MREKGICWLKADLWHAYNGLLIQHISSFCFPPLDFAVTLSHSLSSLNRITWVYYVTEGSWDCADCLSVTAQYFAYAGQTLKPQHYSWRESKVSLRALLITFAGAYLAFIFIKPIWPCMFPVLDILITVKANLNSFNITFKNCWSLCAGHNYKSIRLRNKSQRDFTREGYIAGELLGSLVSQDFQIIQIPPQLKHSWGHTTPQKSVFYSFDASLPRFMVRELTKCHWQKFLTLITLNNLVKVTI